MVICVVLLFNIIGVVLMLLLVVKFLYVEGGGVSWDVIEKIGL